MPGYYYYEKKNRELKIALTILVTLNLAFILFAASNIYTTYNIYSKQSVDYSGNLPNITIVPGLQTKLNHAYELSSVELIYCLYGDYNRTGNLINITNITIPDVITATLTSVEFIACNDDEFIGTLHTHPRNTCEHSYQDMFTFGTSYQRNRNNVLIAGVQCGIDSFVFHHVDDVSEQIIVK